MIVPMKKITVLVTAKKLEGLPQKLRELGILHLSRNKFVASTNETLKLKQEKVKKALKILERYKRESIKLQKHSCPNDFSDKAIKLSQQETQIKKELEQAQNEIEFYHNTGEFDLEQIKVLKKKQIYTRFFQGNITQVSLLPSKSCYQILDSSDNETFLVFFSFKEKPLVPLKEITVPKRNFEELKKLKKTLEFSLGEVQKQLYSFGEYFESLQIELENLEEAIENTNLLNKIKSDKSLVYSLVGYCPKENLEILKSIANENNWGLFVEEPTEKDETPTFLRPSSFFKMGLPLLQLIHTFPGYREHDITPAFLFYMGIFFALLVGDAGYALIFFLLTGILHKTFKQIPSHTFQLGYFFSTLTLAWGALTGNWFGAKSISQISVFQYFKLSSLDAFEPKNQSTYILLCFIIGATHISLAHFIKSFKSSQPLKGVAQIGWIANVWGAFFVVRFLVLEKPIPFFTYHLLIGGTLLVLLFTTPQKNIFKGILQSLGKIPLNLMNCFSDIISYIRLFAVGMATLSVASSFNEIATGIGFQTLSSSFGAAFILFLGHGVNILMALLSVVVHGIRLNMLEFSSHLEMQWTGVEYQPFKKKRRS